jgi:16S rRNA processing protein RimM
MTVPDHAGRSDEPAYGAAAHHGSAPAGMLEIGHIRRAHGLRGEVFVQLVSDRTERLDPGSRLWAAGVELRVAACRTASKGRYVVAFEGIDDRNAAERWADTALYAEPLDDKDEVWVHELIGRRVVDQHGVDRGTCVAVVANPAADLIETADGALVPSNFVVALDGTDVVRVDVPAGLFDDDTNGYTNSDTGGDADEGRAP